MDTTPQILLVDDRKENLIALEGILVDCEAELVRAMSGNEALELMLKRDFALVLLDVQMPGMDGFEVAELMRMNVKTQHLPVVFITAISFEDKHIFKGYEVGAVDFLAKPFNPAILISKVNIFLDLWSQQKKLAEALEVNEKISELLKQQAEFDSLTELPNRYFFYDRLQQAILASERSGKIGALLFIDLDRFKWVNDTFGHDAGDDLLIQVGERLQNCVRKSDTVARLGGDEFTIIVKDLEDRAVIEEIANKVLVLLASPFTLGGKDVEISASIGITVYPTDSNEQEALLKNADTAMYQAKSSGRNAFSYYNAQMSDNAGKRAILESQLSAALEEDALCLRYQPKVDQRGFIIGSEALVSWDRPDYGPVYAAGLIQLADEAGLIEPVSNWILKTACQQGKQWLDAGLGDIRVSVNVYSHQLDNKTGLVQSVNEILTATGLPAQNLELEITEYMLMEKFGIALDTLETLEKLNALGIHLSLDHYGVGYSSLAMLKKIPMRNLKIDNSLVSRVTVDSDSKAIFLATIALARELELLVNTEGVETEEQFTFLKEHGCQEMQGPYFSHPLPAEQYTELLQEAKSLPQSN